MLIRRSTKNTGPAGSAASAAAHIAALALVARDTSVRLSGRNLSPQQSHKSTSPCRFSSSIWFTSTTDKVAGTLPGARCDSVAGGEFSNGDLGVIAPPLTPVPNINLKHFGSGARGSDAHLRHPKWSQRSYSLLGRIRPMVPNTTNSQLISSVYEAFKCGDIHYILSLIAPEATWRQSKMLP